MQRSVANKMNSSFFPLMKSYLLFILFVSFGANVVAQSAPYQTDTDISYYSETGKSGSYLNERCKLDIYYPKNSKGFSTIIWFHGGGLTGGEKAIPEELKGKGFAVVAVNYRLSPKGKCPEYIEDAAAATAWVFTSIKKYGGDPGLIFISGHSAGGYLGSMITLDKKWLARYAIDANKIAGLLPLSGQMITHFTIRQEKGIPETRPVIDEFAPLYHVRADAPPIVLITGDRELEILGRYDENAYMARMLKIVGHKRTELYELGGYGHDMTAPAFPLLVQHVNRLTQEIRRLSK
jgi:acetyl esterase/lipase